MEITSKTKGVIIAIIFILLLILPVSYGLIRAYFGKHSNVPQKDTAIAAPQK